MKIKQIIYSTFLNQPPQLNPMEFDSKRDFYRWLINLIISILTALAAALGTTSCVNAMCG